jgi:hypothetical protein
MNWRAQREVLFVVGKSGTGKTTFVLRFLVNASIRYRFIWDGDGQIAERLNLPAATTAEEMEFSIPSGFVIFNPNHLFDGRHAEGFAWWAAWVYDRCASLEGSKIVVVDEVWRYCKPASIPKPLESCILNGRSRELSCCFCTQHPNKVHNSITGEVTEWVTFCLDHELNLAPLEKAGFDPQQVSKLQKGQWLARAAGGGSLRGKLF